MRPINKDFGDNFTKDIAEVDMSQVLEMCVGLTWRGSILVSVEGVDIVANDVCVGASPRHTMRGNKQSLV